MSWRHNVDKRGKRGGMKMKKIIVFLLLITLVISTASSTFASDDTDPYGTNRVIVLKR